MVPLPYEPPYVPITLCRVYGWFTRESYLARHVGDPGSGAVGPVVEGHGEVRALPLVGEERERDAEGLRGVRLRPRVWG